MFVFGTVAGTPEVVGISLCVSGVVGGTGAVGVTVGAFWLELPGIGGRETGAGAGAGAGAGVGAGVGAAGCGVFSGGLTLNSGGGVPILGDGAGTGGLVMTVAYFDTPDTNAVRTGFDSFVRETLCMLSHSRHRVPEAVAGLHKVLYHVRAFVG